MNVSQATVSTTETILQLPSDLNLNQRRFRIMELVQQSVNRQMNTTLPPDSSERVIRCPICKVAYIEDVGHCACHPALKPAQSETASTGAVRSQLYPKLSDFPIRIDLVFGNPIGLRRLAEAYGEGSIKYGDNNWKKGFDESVLLSHTLEHIRLHMSGDTSEDHLGHATWGLFSLMWMQEEKPEHMGK